jgi:flagellar motility protein MotE (MotC chaperone)
MKKIFVVFVVGCVLFSMSAGVSWFLHQQQQKASEPEEVPPLTLKPGKSVKPFAQPAAETGQAKTTLRPALRTPHNPEAENVLQMASNLRNQMESVKTREQQISMRQKQLELIQQDMQKERETVSGLQKQVSGEMKALLERLDSLEAKAAEVNQQREKASEQVKEIKKTITEFDSAEQTRIKQMAAIYDTMEPESASQILMLMVDSGKMDMAVKILATMRERQAARILALIQDRTVAVQILDKLKGLKKPSQAAP